jgi:hypothetical protein
MSSNGPDDDPEQWDDDDVNFTWDAVDSNQQRFWKLEDTYRDEDNAFIPFPDLVQVKDKYVQLAKPDIEGNRLQDVKTREPLGAVYISDTCFSQLKAGTYEFFQSGVAIRTRDGSPAFAIAVKASTRTQDPTSLTKGLPWKKFFDNGVKATSQFVSLRFANPNIDIVLVPTSTMVTARELQEMVDAIKGTVKQTVTVSSNPPKSLDGKDLIMVCGI